MWQPIVTDWMRAHTLTVLTSERMQEIGFFSHSLFFFFFFVGVAFAAVVAAFVTFSINEWMDYD